MQRDPSCIFCRIAGGEIPASIVHSTESVVAFLDINPLSEGHLLIVPREHVGSLLDMTSALASKVSQELPSLARAVMKATGAEGVNLLMNSGKAAGQVVMHAHIHLIPRRAGDGLGYRWNAGSYSAGRAEAMVAALRSALASGTA